MTPRLWPDLAAFLQQLDTLTSPSAAAAALRTLRAQLGAAEQEDSSTRLSVRCARPVSARAVSTRPVSSCPVWASRRPGVRCPLWASGVRCSVGRPGTWASGVRYPGVPASAVSEPGEFVKRADAASSHTARTAGVGVVAPARYPRPAGRLPESEPDARSWRRPCWANGGVGLAVVEGRSSASGQARPPGRPGGAGCAGTARR
jgi:hypothetical protein